MDAKNAMHILQNLAHNTVCENVHHKKDQQHAFRLPCPVVEEIQQAAGIVSKRIAELEAKSQRLRDILYDDIGVFRKVKARGRPITATQVSDVLDAVQALLGGGG